MTPSNKLKNHFNVILVIGSIWGLSEFVLGLKLGKCALLFSGAIMTGLAFLWLSIAYSLTRSLLTLLPILLIASLFKMSDAIFLPVSLTHGSIMNPLFAFLTISIGFIIILGLFRKGFYSKLGIRIASGAGSALLAVALFPLAGFVTGSPACVHAATSLPVSIVTSPLAMAISMITVPLGYFLSCKYLDLQAKIRVALPGSQTYILSTLFMIICMLTVTLINIF